MEEAAKGRHDERCRQSVSAGVGKDTTHGVAALKVVEVVAADNRRGSVVGVHFVALGPQMVRWQIGKLDLPRSLEVIEIDHSGLIYRESIGRHQQTDEFGCDLRDLETVRCEFDR